LRWQFTLSISPAKPLKKEKQCRFCIVFGV
jgi:hypothetical protein